MQFTGAHKYYWQDLIGDGLFKKDTLCVKIWFPSGHIKNWPLPFCGSKIKFVRIWYPYQAVWVEHSGSMSTVPKTLFHTISPLGMNGPNFVTNWMSRFALFALVDIPEENFKNYLLVCAELWNSVFLRQRLVEVSLSSGNYSRLLADVIFTRSMGYYMIQV